MTRLQPFAPLLTRWGDLLDTSLHDELDTLLLHVLLHEHRSGLKSHTGNELTSMMAFPISSPRIAANGISSIPTKVTLFGSFFNSAMETSIPMKLVPIMTISLSLLTDEVIFLVSSTVRKVRTPSRSAPSIGIFLAIDPGATTR